MFTRVWHLGILSLLSSKLLLMVHLVTASGDGEIDDNEGEGFDEVIRSLLDELIQRVIDEEASISQPSSSSTHQGYEYYLDVCHALLPPCDTLLSVEATHFTRLSASQHYIAVGSSDGVLYLYNRRIQQPVRPLRYSRPVAVTALSFHTSQDESDLLAVGHGNGTLVVLQLPSGAQQEPTKRRMRQMIIDDAHREGNAIVELRWGRDGRVVYTADEDGIVLAVEVDFDRPARNQPRITFIAAESMGVRLLRISQHEAQLETQQTLIAYVVGEGRLKVLQVPNFGQLDCESAEMRDGYAKTVIDQDFEERIIGLDFLGVSTSNEGDGGGETRIGSQQQLCVLLANGDVLLVDLHLTVAPAVKRSLLNIISHHRKTSTSTDSSVDSSWTLADFARCSNAEVLPPSSASQNYPSLVYFSGHKLLLCIGPVSEDIGGRVEIFNLSTTKLFDQLPELEAATIEGVDLAFASGDELYLLTFFDKSRHAVLRLGKLPAPAAMTSTSSDSTAANNSLQLLSSISSHLSSAAQKSSKELLGRLQKSTAVAAANNFIPKSLSSFASVEKFSSATAISEFMFGRGEDYTPPMETTFLRDLLFDPAVREREGLTTILSTADEYRQSLNRLLQEQLRNSKLMEDFDSTLLSPEQSETPTESVYAAIGGEENDSEMASTSSTTDYTRGSIDEIGDPFTSPSVLFEADQANPTSPNRVYKEEVAVLRREVMKRRKRKERQPSTSATTATTDSVETLASNSKEGTLGESVEGAASVEEEKLQMKILNVIHRPDSFVMPEIASTPSCVYEFQAYDHDTGPGGEQSQVEGEIEDSPPSPDPSPPPEEPDEEAPGGITQHATHDLSLPEHPSSSKDSRSSTDPASSSAMTEYSTDYAAHAASTSTRARLGARLSLNADYAPINRLMSAASGCDQWVQMALPTTTSRKGAYEIVSFAVNDSYAVLICRETDKEKKRGKAPLQRPLHKVYYKRFAKDGECKEAEWEEWKLNTMDVAMNGRKSKNFGQPPGENSDLVVLYQAPHYRNPIRLFSASGSLLWHVWDGVAYSPSRTSPSTSNIGANHWAEQTSISEGRVISVAITSRHAWYITDTSLHPAGNPPPSSSTWYLPFTEDASKPTTTSTTSVSVQMELAQLDGILWRDEVSSKLKQIAASDHAVWALKEDGRGILVRVGLKRCPMGTDWVDWEARPLIEASPILSIALHGHSGFALDAEGVLWLKNGVSESNPFGLTERWWDSDGDIGLILRTHSLTFRYQVHSFTQYLSTTIGQKCLSLAAEQRDSWQLRVATHGIYVSTGSAFIHSRHHHPLTAHAFSRALPSRLSTSDSFSLLAAGGFGGAIHEFVFACQQHTATHSELFAFSTRRCNLTSLAPLLPAAGQVVQIEAPGERLYVLDNHGNVYFMAPSKPAPLWNLLPHNPLVDRWLSFAVSTSCIYAISSDFRLFISLEHGHSNSINWIEIDPPKGAVNQGNMPSTSLLIDRVYSSPSGHHLWLLSTITGRCWTRLGLNRVDRIGSVWVEGPSITSQEGATGIRLTSMAIGNETAWALGLSSRRTLSNLYRLRGFSAANPTGHYWKAMTVGGSTDSNGSLQLKAISLGAMDGRLWALGAESGRLLRHEMEIWPRECLERDGVALKEEGGDGVTVEMKKVDEAERMSLDLTETWCMVDENQ